MFLSWVRNRTVSLRHHLLILVIGVLMPVVVFAAALLWRLAVEHRSVAEQGLVSTANDMAASIDRELLSIVRAMKAMAQSPRLERGDLRGFYDEAQRILRVQDTWWHVLLQDTEGNVIVDTGRPFDSPPEKVIEGESYRQVLQTRRPTFGTLKMGPRGEWAAPMRVPVIYDDELKYVLTVLIQPQAVSRILGLDRPVANEWTRSVVDGNHTIVARTRGPETFVGRSASPQFREMISRQHQGVAPTTTLDGVDAYTAYSRAPLSGWTGVVVVPREVLDRPVRISMYGLAGAGLGALLVSAFGATVLSRRVKLGMSDAADAAAAMLRGQRPEPSQSRIAEVALLHDALVRAADLLVVRERERAENLAQALAARKEADAASGAKDKFLAVLSHELRTPLTPVMMAVHLLENDPRHTDATRQMLAMIRRNVQLEVKLIDDLLDLTRVARGKLLLQLSRVDVNEKIRDVAAICEPEIREKGLTLHLNLPPEPCIVGADGARLQQVLWNLLKNAVKFTPESGRITVRTRCDDGLLHVEVTDTGIGIEPASLGRIFDAFEQADEAVTRQFGGLGLGLSISKAIVDLHGGKLSAQSDGPNRGSTFTLTLPLAPAQADDSAEAPQPAARPARSARILLVEDNPDSSHAVTLAMQQCGHSVRAADGVDAALRLAGDERFDVVISDLGLPDGTGYDLMRQLREKYNLRGVALSGFGMEDDIQRSLAAGFDQHLTKPVEIDRLDSAVRAVLEATQPA
jgi:signal transduction histidine kinase/CheY-like chemotaxis protein